MESALSPHPYFLKQIIAFVVLTHFGLMIFLIFITPPLIHELEPKKKLVVTTIKLNPKPQVLSVEKEKPEVIEQVKVVEEKITPPQPRSLPAKDLPSLPKPVMQKPLKKTPAKMEKKKEKPRPLKKKKEEPKISVQKEQPQTPPVKPAPQPQINPLPPKSLVDERQKELLTAAAKKIGKMDTSKDLALSNQSSSLKQVKPLESLEMAIQTDLGDVLNSKETAYLDELAHRLKLLLKFPEYGDVKIQLTLDRSGKILLVKTLKSYSQKNTLYVEKTLPQLKMPAFGNNFTNQADFTFTITLSNQ